ncbi:MAG: transposase [Spirosomataceae bacterium]
MQERKFSETQIIKILKEQESGLSVTDVAVLHGHNSET